MLIYMVYEVSWLIILAPILVSPFILAFGRKLYSGGALIAIGAVVVSLISTLIVLVNLKEPVVVESFEIIPTFQSGNYKIAGFKWSLYLDHLSIITALVVAIVSLLIFIFSIEYLRGDKGIARYFAEISFFVGSMQGLVLSNNLIMLYLFWEFVGLASYLLIGYWHEREEVAKAARKAFLVTRIGDVFFLAGIVILWLNLGYLPSVKEIVDGKINSILASLGLATLVPLLFFGGSIGKSAQFPLHVWLPDAMEGPTTVSALIHSATMVAAGVYLVARLYEMFTIEPLPLIVVGFIGGFTAFYSATLGLATNDVKRVLAYSTISQLGLMMLALGLHIAGSAMLHLYSHAFFKALMFLAAGAIIHELGTRNMLEMGGLSKRIKTSYYGMLIGGLSLIAIPPFSGFFTKDPIIEKAFYSDAVLFTFGILTSFLTALYWARMMYLIYLGNPRSVKAEEAEEANIIMKIPIYGFIILVVSFGLLAQLIPFPYLLNLEFEMLKLKVDVVVLSLIFTAISLLGVYVYHVYYTGKQYMLLLTNSKFGRSLRKILENGYYFDYVYERIAIIVGWYFGILLRFFDEKIIDGIVNGLAYGTKKAGRAIRYFQTGNLEQYLFYVFLTGIIIILLIVII